MNRHLVIGSRGEVGSAVLALVSEVFDAMGLDLNEPAPVGKFDVLHVCIPWSDKFVGIVQDYQEKYGAPGALTIIHATVPVGTSDQCKGVHSPTRGVHPYLLKGLKSFVKYCGGKRANEAAAIFSALGLSAHIVCSARDTEALKLWDTSGYGLNIILEKAIWQYCQENALDFNTVYTHANWTYNEGFKRMGMESNSKYVLEHMDGPIGGHCVLPNCDLLGGTIAEFIKAEASKQ